MSWSASAEKEPIVLVVDDEDVVRKYMQDILEIAGYRVVTARNGAEALRKVAGTRETIALLLTDFEMGNDRNGADLASCIRLLRPETRILITSASVLPEGTIPSGSDWEFLGKPFLNGDLLGRVEPLAGTPRQALPMDSPCPV